MPATKPKPFHSPHKLADAGPGAHTLGIRPGDPAQVVRLVQQGFPFSRLARLQKATEFPWETIARLVAIPQRTITRRQKEGRLQADESDRVLRASRIFDLATELCMGDANAARQWLQTPQLGLGGEVPIEFASTDAGAREVENLIIRLQHGVFT